MEDTTRRARNEGTNESLARELVRISRRESIDESSGEGMDATQGGSPASQEKEQNSTAEREPGEFLTLEAGTFKESGTRILRDTSEPARSPEDGERVRTAELREPSASPKAAFRIADNGRPKEPLCVAKRTQLPALRENSPPKHLASDERPVSEGLGFAQNHERSTGEERATKTSSVETHSRAVLLGQPEVPGPVDRTFGGVRSFKKGLRTAFLSRDKARDAEGFFSARKLARTARAGVEPQLRLQTEEGNGAPNRLPLPNGPETMAGGLPKEAPGEATGSFNRGFFTAGLGVGKDSLERDSPAAVFSPRELITQSPDSIGMANLFPSPQQYTGHVPFPNPFQTPSNGLTLPRSPSALDLLGTMHIPPFGGSQAPPHLQSLPHFRPSLQMPEVTRSEDSFGAEPAEEAAPGISGFKSMLRKKQQVRPGKSTEPDALPVILEGKPVELRKRASVSPKSPMVSESVSRSEYPIVLGKLLASFPLYVSGCFEQVRPILTARKHLAFELRQMLCHLLYYQVFSHFIAKLPPLNTLYYLMRAGVQNDHRTAVCLPALQRRLFWSPCQELRRSRTSRMGSIKKKEANDLNFLCRQDLVESNDPVGGAEDPNGRRKQPGRGVKRPAANSPTSAVGKRSSQYRGVTK